jgi:hypothetical protein
VRKELLPHPNGSIRLDPDPEDVVHGESNVAEMHPVVGEIVVPPFRGAIFLPQLVESVLARYEKWEWALG